MADSDCMVGEMAKEVDFEQVAAVIIAQGVADGLTIIETLARAIEERDEVILKLERKLQKGDVPT